MQKIIQELFIEQKKLIISKTSTFKLRGTFLENPMKIYKTGPFVRVVSCNEQPCAAVVRICELCKKIWVSSY